MASPAPSSLESPERVLSTLYMSLWDALDAVVGESKWFDPREVSAEAKMEDVDRNAAAVSHLDIKDNHVLRQVERDISATKNWIANLDLSSGEQVRQATEFLGRLRDLGLQYRKADAEVDFLTKE